MAAGFEASSAYLDFVCFDHGRSTGKSSDAAARENRGEPMPIHSVITGGKTIKSPISSRANQYRAKLRFFFVRSLHSIEKRKLVGPTRKVAKRKEFTPVMPPTNWAQAPVHLVRGREGPGIPPTKPVQQSSKAPSKLQRHQKEKRKRRIFRHLTAWARPPYSLISYVCRRSLELRRSGRTEQARRSKIPVRQTSGTPAALPLHGNRLERNGKSTSHHEAQVG